MAVQPVYVGQRVLIECKFLLSGVPTDPTVVQLIARDPGGSQITYTYPAEDFVRRDLGFYEAAVLVNTPGTWVFRAEAAGVVDAVYEYALNVEPSAITA